MPNLFGNQTLPVLCHQTQSRPTRAAGDDYSLPYPLATVGRAGNGIHYEDKLPWPTNQRVVESIIRKQVKRGDQQE